MRKELRPVHDLVECDLCGRTILKGERIETFVAGGERRKVCELCTFQALRLGWPRESELAERAVERSRTGPRGSLWSRLVTWAEDQGLLGTPPPTAGDGLAHASGAGGTVEAGPDFPDPGVSDAAHSAGEVPAGGRPDHRERAAPEPLLASEHAAIPPAEIPPDFGDPHLDDAHELARRPGRPAGGSSLKDLIAGRRREPREIQPVPTSREGKLERAFELFNLSEHRRTVAGIGRALGEPWVSARPVGDAPAAREVTVVVAWELSWYRYRAVLDADEQAVELVARGDEIDDLAGEERDWNAGADSDGRLALAVEPVS